MAHIHIQGLDAAANSVIDSLETLQTDFPFTSDVLECIHYKSGGTVYKLPLVKNGICTKDGVNYRYNSSRKALHVISSGSELHVPNEKIETIKFNLTLRFDNTYVSGSYGGYDQCGDVYGWVDATYDNKVTASVTAEKPISSWTLRNNGDIMARLEGEFNSYSSWQTLLSANSVLTSSSPTSPVKRQTFYTQTDYMQSSFVYRTFYCNKSRNQYTLTINFSDGFSIIKYISTGSARSDYDNFVNNKIVYASSGEQTS